jgi:hypothetical protein
MKGVGKQFARRLFKGSLIVRLQPAADILAERQSPADCRHSAQTPLCLHAVALTGLSINVALSKHAGDSRSSRVTELLLLHLTLPAFLLGTLEYVAVNFG